MDSSQFVNSAPEPPTTADLMVATDILNDYRMHNVTDETRNACQRVATFLAHLAPMMDMLRGVLGGSADPKQVQDMLRGML